MGVVKRELSQKFEVPVKNMGRATFGRALAAYIDRCHGTPGGGNCDEEVVTVVLHDREGDNPRSKDIPTLFCQSHIDAGAHREFIERIKSEGGVVPGSMRVTELQDYVDGKFTRFH